MMRTEIEGQAPSIFEDTRPWFATAGDRPLTGLTVLLVEDSRLASEAMRLLCLRSGARIRRADCLRSARRHLQTYRPGVVIVDMGLPDGDGASLIAQMSSAQPHAPVVIGLSGDPDRREQAMAAGANGFLAKPVENLASFQQAILAALPEAVRPRGPRALPDEVILPDAQALQDDLAHLSEILRPGADGPTAAYAAGFLSGLARVAHDPMLALAAQELALDHSPAMIARVQAMVGRRMVSGPLM